MYTIDYHADPESGHLSPTFIVLILYLKDHFWMKHEIVQLRISFHMYRSYQKYLTYLH